MSKITLFCLSVFMIASCNKKDETGTTTVEYQVIATNSSSIAITYSNVVGNKITTSAQNSWTINVINPPKPYGASIEAASTSPFSSVTTSCTVNILVNGAVVKTDTKTSNGVATAAATFTVE